MLQEKLKLRLDFARWSYIGSIGSSSAILLALLTITTYYS